MLLFSLEVKHFCAAWEELSIQAYGHPWAHRDTHRHTHRYTHLLPPILLRIWTAGSCLTYRKINKAKERPWISGEFFFPKAIRHLESWPDRNQWLFPGSVSFRCGRGKQRIMMGEGVGVGEEGKQRKKMSKTVTFSCCIRLSQHIGIITYIYL